MEKPQYKAVLLVLASETLPLYAKLKEVQEKFINTNKDIKVFYVYAGKVSFEPKNHDLVYPELTESVIQPHPAKKVVKALEYICDICTFDYLVRTNISTFWLFDRLLARLNSLPKLPIVSGRLGVLKPDFVVGSDMVITGSLIYKLIENQKEVYLQHKGRYIPEDRILSEFFTNNCKAKIVPAEHAVHQLEKLTNTDNIDLIKAPTDKVDHFRVKNLYDRDTIDPAVFTILYDLYYKDSIK